MKKQELIEIAKIVTDIDDFVVIDITDNETYFELKYKWGHDINKFIISLRNNKIFFVHANSDGISLNQFGHQEAIEYLQQRYNNLTNVIKEGLYE